MPAGDVQGLTAEQSRTNPTQDFCINKETVGSCCCWLSVCTFALPIFAGLAYLAIGGALTFAASLVHPVFALAVALAFIVGGAFLISPEFGFQCLFCLCLMATGGRGY